MLAGRSVQSSISAARREADYAHPGGRQWASAVCYLNGGGPLLVPDQAPAVSDAAAAGEGDDYAALRTMIAQRNLEALRMQSERLGAAAPDTLARQIAEWEQADPGAPA